MTDSRNRDFIPAGEDPGAMTTEGFRDFVPATEEQKKIIGDSAYGPEARTAPSAYQAQAPVAAPEGKTVDEASQAPQSVQAPVAPAPEVVTPPPFVAQAPAVDPELAALQAEHGEPTVEEVAANAEAQTIVTPVDEPLTPELDEETVE